MALSRRVQSPSSQFYQRQGMTPENAQHQRPQSEILSDLHLYVIPADSWRQDLQSALNEVTSQSVSLGFVRVNPDSRLADLRDEMPAQLDTTQLPSGFAFLRSVGRCFAKVTKKQESKLKVKYFMPPYAASHEIFLLPAGTTGREDDAASSTSSDALSLRADSLASLQSLRLGAAPAAPAPAASSAPSTPPLHHEKPGSLPKATAISKESTKSKGNTQTPKQGLSRASTVTLSSGGDRHEQQQQLQQQQQPQSVAEATLQPARSSSSASSGGGDYGRVTGGAVAEDMLAEPQVSSASAAENNRARKELSEQASPSKADAKADEVHAPLDVELSTQQLTAARQARLEAERKRADVIKKVKLLQSKTDSRRLQAKEMWKRRYFEEKQKTPTLEDSCDSLKVLIAAVRQKSLQRAAGRIGFSNGVAVTADQATADQQHAAVMKLEYEIEDLRYQVERASMQVTAELKLRTQAETELRVLRAELVQHKINAGGALPSD